MNTWTLTVQGVDWTLRELSPGWTNLTVATEQLRTYATEQLRALDSGHVVSNTLTESSAPSVAWLVDQALNTKRT